MCSSQLFMMGKRIRLDLHLFVRGWEPMSNFVRYREEALQPLTLTYNLLQWKCELFTGNEDNSHLSVLISTRFTSSNHAHTPLVIISPPKIFHNLCGVLL